mmetsp:Transcript_46/g.52  ORF Transcript_46/g.52 Transcript_46/m.52 type:complete len:189 (+) Transcript_46:104-670(+)|eukprot:Skav207391  [mRNA]  locus=scaffold2421:81098:81664:+ [translate_table: standard]
MSLIPTPSAGTGLDISSATEKEIKDFLGSLSEGEHEKFMEALKIVEKEGPSSPVKFLSCYRLQCTDRGWGFYMIEVKVNSDGSGTVEEQVCKNETDPQVTERWSGKFSSSGDSLIFQGTEVEMMWDTGKVAEFKQETKTGNKEYRFQKADEKRLLHLGEDGLPLDDPYPETEGQKQFLYSQTEKEICL